MSSASNDSPPCFSLSDSSLELETRILFFTKYYLRSICSDKNMMQGNLFYFLFVCVCVCVCFVCVRVRVCLFCVCVFCVCVRVCLFCVFEFCFFCCLLTHCSQRVVNEPQRTSVVKCFSKFF